MTMIERNKCREMENAARKRKSRREARGKESLFFNYIMICFPFVSIGLIGRCVQLSFRLSYMKVVSVSACCVSRFFPYDPCPLYSHVHALENSGSTSHYGRSRGTP